MMTSTHEISESSALGATILDRKKSYALIARFVKAGGCITQKQLQEAQKRYVNTPEGVIILLEGEIRNLCREIETLVQESQQIYLGNSLSNVAAKYFGLLFTSDLLGYMREVAIADVLFNDGYGPEAGISLGGLTM
ncbi:hypothetical protein P3T76_015395 [Phytophthora citrophthora]|uniref:Uncharacterized protein n=1 Tax=Phytophthora citrophthora TaxID=4793 RepID=A0AAD9FZI2_9STRA|nr:hypothetical protein P3T76_015395 [Phytophthora citrophthora]